MNKKATKKISNPVAKHNFNKGGTHKSKKDYNKKDKRYLQQREE